MVSALTHVAVEFGEVCPEAGNGCAAARFRSSRRLEVDGRLDLSLTIGGREFVIDVAKV